METGTLRRKDTTKGPPLRILSLDGGGVRGYSMLILLQELMYKVYNETEGVAPRRHQIPKPCDYFDLIGGTGTGGLIAIMIGRLRLDLETCKEVYIRMTRKVFETDKTIAGIPYRSTLFKASKLEEAIKECVREHTIFDDEGNDGTAAGGLGNAPAAPRRTSTSTLQKRNSIASSIGSSGYSSGSPRSPFASSSRWGNPNASLYDSRENRTKTAVTAVYKDTPPNGGSVLLRSYDSRKEPPAEFICSIWQAGRATSATGLAFKPIQIGQSMFHDEGAGKYNPAPQIMDEAAVNEWPGREIGVFVSIGTGKRPGGNNNNNKQHEWWEEFVGGGLGDFAEARRRLISKIEGCEETHQYMMKEHLSKRGVNAENYYRLNVEVGVGEFGMNEWSRLADISTSTRRYLSKPETKAINEAAAAKMGRIERAKRRQQAHDYAAEMEGGLRPGTAPRTSVPPPLDPMAVELPGSDGGHSFYQSRQRPLEARPVSYQSSHYSQLATPDDKFAVLSPNDIPAPARRSNEMANRANNNGPRVSDSSIISAPSPPRRSHESNGGDNSRNNNSNNNTGSNVSAVSVGGARTEAPPLPPKMPMYSSVEPPARVPPIPPVSPLRAQFAHSRGNSNSNANTGSGASNQLPYPDDDGPPPVVNMARKPEFVGR